MVKVLKPGHPERLLRLEADGTRVAVMAGAPAPRVHELVQVGVRPGIVVDRVTRDSMVDLPTTDIDRWEDWAHLLARTHADILGRTPSDLVDVRDLLQHNIEAADPLISIKY